MNTELKEINEIISICDAMIKQIRNDGILYSRNQEYEEYKERINSFLTSHKLMRIDYGPFAILRFLYFNNYSYTVNLSEAKAIRDTVIGLKHELFPDAFEKIFIFHAKVKTTAF